MGAQLVAHVYASWAHLPDRPFRLLAHMALVCLDDDREPRYWGGREAMAQALGLEPGLDSSHTMVKRARRMLEESGAIDCVRVGRAGKRSEYLLLINRISTHPSRGYSDDPLRGYSDDPLRGYSDDPPRNNRGNNRGIQEDRPSSTKVRLRRRYPQAAETA